MKILDKIIEFEALDKKELGNDCFIKYAEYHDGVYEDTLCIIKRATEIVNSYVGGKGHGYDDGPIRDITYKRDIEYPIGYIYYDLSTKQLTPVVTREKFLNDFNSAITTVYKLLPNLTIQLKDL